MYRILLIIIILGACKSTPEDQTNISFSYCLKPTFQKIKASENWYNKFVTYSMLNQQNQFFGGLLVGKDTLLLSFKDELQTGLEIQDSSSYVNGEGITMGKMVIKAENIFNYRIILYDDQSENYVMIDQIFDQLIDAKQAYNQNLNTDPIINCN